MQTMNYYNRHSASGIMGPGGGDSISTPMDGGYGAMASWAPADAFHSHTPQQQQHQQRFAGLHANSSASDNAFAPAQRYAADASISFQRPPRAATAFDHGRQPSIEPPMAPTTTGPLYELPPEAQRHQYQQHQYQQHPHNPSAVVAGHQSFNVTHHMTAGAVVPPHHHHHHQHQPHNPLRNGFGSPSSFRHDNEMAASNIDHHHLHNQQQQHQPPHHQHHQHHHPNSTGTMNNQYNHPFNGDSGSSASAGTPSHPQMQSPQTYENSRNAQQSHVVGGDIMMYSPQAQQQRQHNSIPHATHFHDNRHLQHHLHQPIAPLNSQANNSVASASSPFCGPQQQQPHQPQQHYRDHHHSIHDHHNNPPQLRQHKETAYTSTVAARASQSSFNEYQQTANADTAAYQSMQLLSNAPHHFHPQQQQLQPQQQHLLPHQQSPTPQSTTPLPQPNHVHHEPQIQLSPQQQPQQWSHQSSSSPSPQQPQPQSPCNTGLNTNAGPVPQQPAPINSLSCAPTPNPPALETAHAADATTAITSSASRELYGADAVAVAAHTSESFQSPQTPQPAPPPTPSQTPNTSSASASSLLPPTTSATSSVAAQPQSRPVPPIDVTAATTATATTAVGFPDGSDVVPTDASNTDAAADNGGADGDDMNERRAENTSAQHEQDVDVPRPTEVCESSNANGAETATAVASTVAMVPTNSSRINTPQVRADGNNGSARGDETTSAPKSGSIPARGGTDDLAEVTSNYPTPPPSTMPPFHHHHQQQQQHHHHQRQQQQHHQQHATDQHFPDGFNTEAINCHRQSSAAPRPGAVCGETEAAAAAGEEREKNLSKMAAMNRKLENDTFYGSSTLMYEMDRAYNTSHHPRQNHHYPTMSRHPGAPSYMSEPILSASPYFHGSAAYHPYSNQHQNHHAQHYNQFQASHHNVQPHHSATHYPHRHPHANNNASPTQLPPYMRSQMSPAALHHMQHPYHPHHQHQYHQHLQYPGSQSPWSSAPRSGGSAHGGYWAGPSAYQSYAGGPTEMPSSAYSQQRRLPQMLSGAIRTAAALSPGAETPMRRSLYGRPGRPPAQRTATNGVFEMDVIPTKKRRKNAKTVVATATATPSKTDRDADREATSRVASETKVTPLPGFLQAFGSTEIGRFSEMFFNSPDSPFDSFSMSPAFGGMIDFDADAISPQLNTLSWSMEAVSGEFGSLDTLDGGASNFFVPSGGSSVHSMNAESYTSTGSPASSGGGASYFGDLARGIEY